MGYVNIRVGKAAHFVRVERHLLFSLSLYLLQGFTPEQLWLMLLGRGTQGTFQLHLVSCVYCDAMPYPYVGSLCAVGTACLEIQVRSTTRGRIAKIPPANI